MAAVDLPLELQKNKQPYVWVDLEYFAGHVGLQPLPEIRNKRMVWHNTMNHHNTRVEKVKFFTPGYFIYWGWNKVWIETKQHLRWLGDVFIAVLKVQCNSMKTNLLSLVDDDNQFLIFSLHIHKKLISFLARKWYLWYQSTLRQRPKNNLLLIKMERKILLHLKRANHRKILSILECG